MEWIREWARAKRMCFLFGFALWGVFVVVYLLYKLPMDSLVYASGVAGFICIFICLSSFFDFKRKCVKIRDSLNNLPDLSGLPPASSLWERGYHSMLRKCIEDNAVISNKAQNEHNEAADYYGTWIHQIKVPIASLRLILQSEEAEDLPVSFKRMLRHQLFSIEQYTDMALQYQRLHEGTDLVLEECAYEDLIKDTVKHLSLFFMASGVSLQVDKIYGSVITDKKWFQFILEQIISNAVKYSPGGKVSVSMKNPSSICIEDNGIGIHKEDIARIFERSYTGINGHLERYSTGVGMYLCRKTANLLQLEISIESTPGVGTKVSISHHQKDHYIE